MRVLNRHNLSIASLASREESRYTLSSILVTPDQTVETDGHQLIIVTTAEVKPLPGTADENQTIDRCLIPADVARQIAQKMPKGSSSLRVRRRRSKGNDKPQRQVKINPGSNGHVTIDVGDAERTYSIKFAKQSGQFPAYDKAFPKGEPVAVVGFNPALLGKVLAHIATFSSSVKVEIRDTASPIVLRATNSETGQELTALVMPMRID